MGGKSTRLAWCAEQLLLCVPQDSLGTEALASLSLPLQRQPLPQALRCPLAFAGSGLHDKTSFFTALSWSLDFWWTLVPALNRGPPWPWAPFYFLESPSRVRVSLHFLLACGWAKTQHCLISCGATVRATTLDLDGWTKIFLALETPCGCSSEGGSCDGGSCQEARGNVLHYSLLELPYV